MILMLFAAIVLASSTSAPATTRLRSGIT